MKILLTLLIPLMATQSVAQESLAQLLNRYNTHDIPYITVQELAMPKTNYHILDAREPEEYNVSHINQAKHIGYNHFKIENVLQEIPNKNDTIVVYCSLGIRSETISRKLKKVGYTTIYNLYGGIFEWKNNQFPVYNSKGKQTDSIHAFSKPWSKWLHSGEKIYSTNEQLTD